MLNLTPLDEAKLQQEADVAIIQSLNASRQLPGKPHGWLPGAPTSEREAVAAVVSVGCPDTASRWKRVLQPLGYQVQIIGVYCHQKPYVDFMDKKGQPQMRELADLLLVVDDIKTNDRRALLVQAKLINGVPYRLATLGDLAQFDLYDNWPPFNFRARKLKRSTSFNLHSISAPGMAAQSGCYGAIDILPTPVGWEQLAPSLTLTPGTGNPLSEELAKMVSGAAGRAAVIGGADDWSQCVDTLLTHTYHAATQSFASAPSRGITSIAFLGGSSAFAGIGLRISGLPPDGFEEGDVPEGEGPGSLVHVRIWPRSLPEPPK